MKFEMLTTLEVYNVLRLIPAAVQAQLVREDVVVAGGAIRDTVTGLPVKDLDIFCHSEEQAGRLAAEVSPFVRHTLFAYSVALTCGHTRGSDEGGFAERPINIPVQYVFYKDFTTPEDLISQFDFRACCAGVYWTKVFGWSGVAVEGFHADCNSRVLRFMSQVKDAGKLTALGRALSLAQKGWKLSTEEAAAIITHFSPTHTPEQVRHAFRPGYGGRR
jgi:hypothetical protein